MLKLMEHGLVKDLHSFSFTLDEKYSYNIMGIIGQQIPAKHRKQTMDKIMGFSVHLHLFYNL